MILIAAKNFRPTLILPHLKINQSRQLPNIRVICDTRNSTAYFSDLVIFKTKG